MRADLLSVFGGDAEKVNDILTMAYYPFVDNMSFNHLSQWQREVKAPSGRVLDAKAVTTLSQSITEQNRMDMFRRRAGRLDKGELCAVDSTSISTYGFNLVDIRWGRNKELLPLAQTVQVVVYSLTSHMPIYYKELPGNMPDSRTAELIMTELEHAGFKNLILVTDRGYESMKNLELYISKRQKVITSVKTCQGEVLKLIKSISFPMGRPDGMKFSSKEGLFYMQKPCQYIVEGGRGKKIRADKMRINLYFDAEARAQAINRIETMLEAQEAEAERWERSREPVDDEAAVRVRLGLLTLAFDKRHRLLSHTLNKEKYGSKLLRSGFFANKTVGVDLTPLQALDTYGMRDEQEKCFALEKGPLGQDRTRCYTETAKHGRTFICFISLILASYVKSVWNADDYLRKRYTSVEAMLAEMRTIRCIEHADRVKFITPFVGDQVYICQAFGFAIPDGCAPTYVSKRKQTSPGRPASAPKAEPQEF